MRNVLIRTKEGETPSDTIAQICEIEGIDHDTPFAFSAIKTGDKLKINCLVARENPYTPTQLVYELCHSQYAVPPLECYIEAYTPLLHKMVNRVQSFYQKLIPDRDDIMSILYLSIVKLYNKGYYLHKRLIYKTFINDLNMEVRKLKDFSDVCSLDEQISDDEGQSTTRLDMLSCPSSSDMAYGQYHYTREDYWEDMLEKLKSVMLQDMSQLSYDRILIQLKTKSISRDTSRVLAKYRQMFCPENNPRPNNTGNNHYTRRR